MGNEAALDPDKLEAKIKELDAKLAEKNQPKLAGKVRKLKKGISALFTAMPRTRAAIRGKKQLL